jgi:uncharacterized protein YdaU (DUF1376 family)
MALPWFAFHVEKYLADTTHLSTEASGAYLWLLLRYYNKGVPLPNDDRMLAAIARLPLDRWLEHKPFLIEFFEVTDTVWDHKTVRDELRDGQRRHERTLAATAAANAAREARKTATSPSRSPSRPPSDRGDGATDTVTDTVTDSATVTVMRQQKQKQEQSKERPPLAARASPQPEIQPGPGWPGSNALGSQLEETWVPGDDGISHAEMLGLDPGQQLLRFHAHHASIGTWSTDWGKCWTRWCCDNAAPPAARALVVVNSEPPKPRRKRAPGRTLPPDWKPNEAAYEVAEKHGQSVAEIEEIFRDYLKQSGTLYNDYDAAFRGFIRRQASFNRGGSNGVRQAGQRKGSIIRAADELGAELDRRIAAREAIERDHALGPSSVLGLPDH